MLIQESQLIIKPICSIMYCIDDHCVHDNDITCYGMQGPVASQLLDTTLKDMVSVACSDVGRRGAKTFLAFASGSGSICAFNVAYVWLHMFEC